LKTKWLAILAIVLIAVPAATGCAATSDSTFEWRFYGTEDFNSVNAPVWSECFEALAERTEGRLNVEVLWLGEHPYEGFDMLDVVSEGTCELGHTQGLDLTGVEPIMGGLSLLFLVPDEATGKRVNDRVNEELINPYLADKYNLEILGAAVGGGQAVHASKELNSFEAMEGMRIRVFNKETADAIGAMGGVPQTMEGAEVYQALQKGILDGALTAAHYAYDQKWYEVVKYVTKWNEFVFSDNILMNLDAYNDLPDDLQEILRDTVSEYSVKVQDEMLAKSVTALEAAASDYDVTVKEMDAAFRTEVVAKVQPLVWDGWAERAGSMGDEFFAIVNDELGS